MTQKIDYTKILKEVGAKFGDIGIINGKEWTLTRVETRYSDYVFKIDTEVFTGPEEKGFKLESLWRRADPDYLVDRKAWCYRFTEKTAITEQRCIWDESQLPKPKRTVTIEVEEGAEVLVDGKKIEVND